MAIPQGPNLVYSSALALETPSQMRLVAALDLPALLAQDQQVFQFGCCDDPLPYTLLPLLTATISH